MWQIRPFDPLENDELEATMYQSETTHGKLLILSCNVKKRKELCGVDQQLEIAYFRSIFSEFVEAFIIMFYLTKNEFVIMWILLF